MNRLEKKNILYLIVNMVHSYSLTLICKDITHYITYYIYKYIFCNITVVKPYPLHLPAHPVLQTGA